MQPDSFRWYYKFDNPGHRSWVRQGNHWTEYYPGGGVPGSFTVIQHGVQISSVHPGMNGVIGSLLKDNRENRQVFIPDFGSKNMWLWLRTDRGSWTFLGEMEQVVCAAYTSQPALAAQPQQESVARMQTLNEVRPKEKTTTNAQRLRELDKEESTAKERLYQLDMQHTLTSTIISAVNEILSNNNLDSGISSCKANITRNGTSLKLIYLTLILAYHKLDRVEGIIENLREYIKIEPRNFSATDVVNLERYLEVVLEKSKHEFSFLNLDWMPSSVISSAVSGKTIKINDQEKKLESIDDDGYFNTSKYEHLKELLSTAIYGSTSIRENVPYTLEILEYELAKALQKFFQLENRRGQNHIHITVPLAQINIRSYLGQALKKAVTEADSQIRNLKEQLTTPGTTFLNSLSPKLIRMIRDELKVATDTLATVEKEKEKVQQEIVKKNRERTHVQEMIRAEEQAQELAKAQAKEQERKKIEAEKMRKAAESLPTTFTELSSSERERFIAIMRTLIQEAQSAPAKKLPCISSQESSSSTERRAIEAIKAELRPAMEIVRNKRRIQEQEEFTQQVTFLSSEVRKAPLNYKQFCLLSSKFMPLVSKAKQTKDANFFAVRGSLFLKFSRCPDLESNIRKEDLYKGALEDYTRALDYNPNINNVPQLITTIQKELLALQNSKNNIPIANMGTFENNAACSQHPNTREESFKAHPKNIRDPAPSDQALKAGAVPEASSSDDYELDIILNDLQEKLREFLDGNSSKNKPAPSPAVAPKPNSMPKSSVQRSPPTTPSEPTRGRVAELKLVFER